MSFKFVVKKMCGKKKHSSLYKAKNQIRYDLKRKLYEEGDKHPYYCPFCNYWHVGGG